MGTCFLITRSQATGGNPAIEQQINLIHGLQTSATNGNQGIVYVDTSRYPGATYYFEVVAKVNSGQTGSADLVYGAGSGSTPSGGSTVTIGSINATAYTRYRSPSFSLTTGNAYINNFTGAGISVVRARLIIDQASATSITDTQTQLDLGANSTTANSTDVPIGGTVGREDGPGTAVNMMARLRSILKLPAKTKPAGKPLRTHSTLADQAARLKWPAVA